METKEEMLLELQICIKQKYYAFIKFATLHLNLMALYEFE